MAANITFVIHKGTDFERDIKITDNGSTLDITGYTITGKMAQDFHTETTQEFLTTATNASQGQFRLSLTDTETSALTPGEHVYTVTMQDTSGKKTRIAYGNITVKDEV